MFLQKWLNTLKKNADSISSREAGYTLITTMIVIMTLGFVIAALASLYLIYEKKQSVIETEGHMTAAREAIERFVNIKGHLPCPAPMNAAPDSQYYNQERESGSACRTAVFSNMASEGIQSVDGFHDGASNRVHIGALPTRTLGIGDQYAVDGHGKRIVYAVTSSYTDPDTAEFKKVEGQIDMQDQNGNSALSSGGTAIYTIISPGSDDRGAYTITGQQIEPCDTSSFAGENCDFSNAIFNVSMNRNFDNGNDKFTNTFYYKAALNIYRWDVDYQNCQCYRQHNGTNYFKTMAAKLTCVDQDGNPASSDSLCTAPPPDDTPVDCSGHSAVTNCYDWHVQPAYNPCPSQCGLEASTIFPVSLTSTCMRYQGTESQAGVDPAITNDDPTNTKLFEGSFTAPENGGSSALECYRENMSDPVEANYPKACPKTEVCYQWRESWGGWSACSAVCQGTQSRSTYWQCYNPETGAGVSDYDCIKQGKAKPASRSETQACGGVCYQWRENWGGWGGCSASCEGTQSRTSWWQCYNPQTDGAVGDGQCYSQGKGKPGANTQTQSCGGACPPPPPPPPPPPTDDEDDDSGGGDNAGNTDDQGNQGGMYTQTSSDNDGGTRCVVDINDITSAGTACSGVQGGGNTDNWNGGMQR